MGGTPKRILLFGKTGVGKTTFIQMAHEHSRKSNYESPRNFIVPIIVGDKNIGLVQPNGSSSVHSQTKDITTYIMPQDDQDVEFIDTQGLFDTEGITLNELGQKLSDYLAENTIHAICLVISASDARITQQIQDMFTLLNQIFGDNAAKPNFFALVTFGAMENQNIKMLLNDYVIDSKKRIFYFDNCCVIPPNESAHIGTEFGSMIWRQHQMNYNSFIHVVLELIPLQSKIFKERALLFTNAKTQLLNQQAIEKNNLDLDSTILKVQAKIKLAQDHKYMKWNCGYIGPNIPINTTNTPIYGTKRQGGIGGMMGGTKSYIIDYNTTYSCGKCGGSPSHHTSQEMVKLDSTETLYVQTYNELTKSVSSMQTQKQKNLAVLEDIKKNLKIINDHLNQLSSLKRNYIDELKAQIL